MVQSVSILLTGGFWIWKFKFINLEEIYFKVCHWFHKPVIIIFNVMKSLFSWELEGVCVLEKKIYSSYPVPFLKPWSCENSHVYEVLIFCIV